MKQIIAIAIRECRTILHYPIYWFILVVFPILSMVYFTSFMDEGQPLDMPIGVVDLDNSTTTRKLTRMLDAFETSHVVAHYGSFEEARKAIQQNKIYGFIYFPENTTEELLASRQPKISFYYTMTSITAGSLIFRDLKTISTLGSAAVGSATMTAKGYTSQQIQTFLQPITIELHQLENPYSNYNYYLSAVFVPGVMMLFIFMISAYVIGTEIKFGKAKEWMEMADNHLLKALAGKLLPYTLIFLTVSLLYQVYVFGVLHFPHQGGVWSLIGSSLLMVLPSEAFGVFMFGLMPSLRMSMSICSLWSVLSFSIAGNAFPVMAMDAPLQSLSWLFPLRHYFMIYQAVVFNGFSVSNVQWHVWVLVALCLLPLTVFPRMKRALLTYEYMP